MYFVIGELVAGFYSALVLVGNHENEVRFKENPQVSFVDHQIKTSRNYANDSLFWLILMGGMQYQAEHHLFPQIPFYRLPNVVGKIEKELTRMNKKIIYGPIVD